MTLISYANKFYEENMKLSSSASTLIKYNQLKGQTGPTDLYEGGGLEITNKVLEAYRNSYILSSRLSLLWKNGKRRE